MERRSVFVSLACLLMCATTGAAQQAIILVRHAEKETDPTVIQGLADRNIPLSETGKARAKALASHLKEARVDAVYTTSAKRTKDTAAPLAAAINKQPMEIKTDTMNKLAERHKDQIVVIVAHSGGAVGVPKFIDQITGKQNGITIDESEFDKLFILLPKKDGTWSLTRAQYGSHKSMNP